MKNVVIRFLVGFIKKYLTTIVIEKILIYLLEVLVNRTDSKIDNEIFNLIFKKIEGDEENDSNTNKYIVK